MNAHPVNDARASDPTQWFVSPRVHPDPATRLILFPHAGGGPSAFRKLSTALPNYIEGWVAHLPGRGSRYSEAPRRSLAQLVKELIHAFRPLLDRPFAFFGHSFGALLAYELTRELRRRDLPQPAVLFVSACRAPHLPNSRPMTYCLPDAEFLAELSKFGSIPQELLSEPEVMKLFLPVLRADSEAFETYIYTVEPPLDSCIIALGGTDDPRVGREELEAWATHTTATFESEYFTGDHFYIDTAREAVIACIVNRMRSSIKS